MRVVTSGIPAAQGRCGLRPGGTASVAGGQHATGSQHAAGAHGGQTRRRLQGLRWGGLACRRLAGLDASAVLAKGARLKKEGTCRPSHARQVCLGTVMRERRVSEWVSTRCSRGGMQASMWTCCSLRIRFTCVPASTTAATAQQRQTERTRWSARRPSLMQTGRSLACHVTAQNAVPGRCTAVHSSVSPRRTARGATCSTSTLLALGLRGGAPRVCPPADPWVDLARFGVDDVEDIEWGGQRDVGHSERHELAI